MPASALACPRCRYDLSGAVGSWASACPLQGTCSECGAPFEWADVFRPERRVVRGFFEHARGAWRTPLWSLTTLLWTALPWIYWRRVGDRPLVLPRAWLWPLVASAPFYVLGSMLFMVGHLVWLYGVMSPPGAYEWWAGLNCWIGPVFSIVPRFPPPGLSLQVIPGRWMLLAGASVTLCVVFPLVLLALNRLPSSPALPTRMILRAALYSFTWVPVAMMFRLAHAVWYVDVTIGWARAPGYTGRAAFLKEFAVAGGAALLLWIGLWWWCALAAMVGRRNAVRFWLACAIAGCLAAALVLAHIQDFLVASR